MSWPISHSRQWLWKKLKHKLDEHNNAEVIVTQVQTKFVCLHWRRTIIKRLIFYETHTHTHTHTHIYIYIYIYIVAFKRTRVLRKYLRILSGSNHCLNLDSWWHKNTKLCSSQIVVIAPGRFSQFVCQMIIKVSFAIFPWLFGSISFCDRTEAA